MNKNVLSKVKNLSADQKQELLSLLEELEKAKGREKCHEDFMTFVGEMWSAFIHGRHHEIMADAFERVAKGDLKRLIIICLQDIPRVSSLRTCSLRGS